MKQQAQANLMMGIGAVIVAVAIGYFGLDAYLSKEAKDKPAAAPAAAVPGTDFSATVNAAAERADGSGHLTAEEARSIGEEVARKVAEQVARSVIAQAPSSPAAATGGDVAVLTEADARRIGAEEGRRVAEEIVAAMAPATSGDAAGGMSAAEAEQIGLAAGRRAAEQVAASTAREVVRKEFGGQAAAAPAARSKPKAEKAATTSSHPVDTAPPADALKAWWTAPAEGEFGLSYAGQAKGERAIALMFSEAPAAGALASHVKVYNIKGVLVSGSWSAGSNPRMGLLKKLKPGRYTVIIDRSLTSASGKTIQKALHGPVYVR